MLLALHLKTDTQQNPAGLLTVLLRHQQSSKHHCSDAQKLPARCGGFAKHTCYQLQSAYALHKRLMFALHHPHVAWTGKVKTYRKLNSDLPALLDEWAASLFKELDYVREAQNGVRFKRLYGELEVSPSTRLCCMVHFVC